MKKILLSIGIGLILLLVLAVLAVGLFLDGAVKRGVETIGSRLTRVDVRLESVSLSLLSGSGAIKGLVVGNPEGFKTPQAISVGSVSLALQPGSIFSDKVVIKSINLEAPEITFEGGFGGNNLSTILANVKSSAGGGTATSANTAPNQEGKPGKKLEVDDFSITGAKLHVSLKGMDGRSIQGVLPEIHLTDLGKGPEGITSAELTERVLTAIEQAALKGADKALAGLDKNAAGLVRELNQGSATGAVDSITRTLDLLKKK